MDKNTIIYMIIFLCVILFLSLNKTFSLIIKLAFNVILGIALLSLTNFILKSNGLNVGINLITTIISGTLGIPGIIGLYILNIML